MDIRLLNEADHRMYNHFILRGVKEHPDCFRISVQDVMESPDPLLSENPDDFTLAAIDENGELLGVVSFERETHEKLLHKGLLLRMYVAAEASSRGIGRALIQQTVTLASLQSGLEQIVLTVLSHNTKARKLYASEGFVTISHEPQALKSSDMYFDEEQMVLYL
jgi:RimJ/RimL family protein N-acetyltransferase